MDNKTVKELQAIARERGVRGYSKLRKAELVELLKPVVTPTLGGGNLLDEPVPNIEVPVLQPTAASKPKLFSRVKQNFSVLGNKIRA